MINFIVCEDNLEVRKINEQIINKLMFKNSIDYKIHSFNSYDNDLNELMHKHIGKKVYILDIELENKSGIDVAHEIRKEDWNSIIIVATAHTELFPQIFKDRLLLFDFVSKFENYQENLLSTLNKVIRIYQSDKMFTFNIRKTTYSFKYDEILYLKYDKTERKTILKTLTSEYKISKSMKSLSINLPDYFVKINNHCIINKNNLISYSSKGYLVFKNKEILNEKINNNKEVEEFVLD